MLLIRIGGFLFYYANMQLASVAPRIKGTIITVYSGLFDSSSSVFYIVLVNTNVAFFFTVMLTRFLRTCKIFFCTLQLAYYAGFSIQSSFLVYVVGLVVPLIFTFLLFPIQKPDSENHCKRFPELVMSSFDKQVPVQNCDNTQTLASAVVDYPDVEANNTNVSLKGKAKVISWLKDRNLCFLMDGKFYSFLFLLSVLTLRMEFFLISYDTALVKSAGGDHQLGKFASSALQISTSHSHFLLIDSN